MSAEANISRDRLAKIDLTSWRYQAAGMPGGVMLTRLYVSGWPCSAPPYPPRPSADPKPSIVLSAPKSPAAAFTMSR
jgi:hypothetical protein